MERRDLERLVHTLAGLLQSEVDANVGSFLLEAAFSGIDRNCSLKKFSHGCSHLAKAKRLTQYSVNSGG